jgi:hypothetical protein
MPNHSTAPHRGAFALGTRTACGSPFPSRSWLLAGVVGILWSLGCVSVAEAGLGEPTASVARDHAAIHGATLSVIKTEKYDVHETTTENGTRMRQYVNRSGTVFGVTWSGSTMPNLKLVLGTRYQRYLAAASVHRTNHHLMNISEGDFVLHIRKMQRGITGTAYVPSLVPADVSATDIR